ncbi:MAG: Asp-tRNA(Asn)/Glu-tRNA(Gln) amidotransferase subunit GatB [Anaerolineales bacterium]|nr:Asp-tRNA(Asn)/Glu-tRNA(Gln) amidotransferase subunit GatB [Anaerolineales bacterium]
MEFEAVIGLEVHAELDTRSKMFCSCPVLDSTLALPNTAVCPVCAGMPGALPTLNQKAVEYGIRLALALECQVNPRSIFARKNYFYPDLPKGYQISQYEEPLARNGRLTIYTSQGERVIRVRRAHLEEDAGKLTHVSGSRQAHSLVDLNRAGVPLLEIVSEPDLRTPEEVRLYAMALRSIMRYLQINSGDMQKGVLRIEPNISIRPRGIQEMGTRTEVKNLNSFRALERSVAYEIQRQTEILCRGGSVTQETLGWDEGREITYTQRSKEEAEDYRYFPEPDLPPLIVENDWIEAIRLSLPELPARRLRRFQEQYQLSDKEASVLIEEKAVADYFEQTLAVIPGSPARSVAPWISGELFALLNQANLGIGDSPVRPAGLARLIMLVLHNEINHNTAKTVLGEMFQSGEEADAIVSRRSLRQISDTAQIAALVRQVLAENPQQVAAYRAGKQTIAQWLFGQVMRLAGGQANPQLVRQELERCLADESSLSTG